MTDYTITTNFGAKDILNTGDSGKVIKGAEFTTEFQAIRTAVNSKANSNSPTFSGTATLPTANITTLNLSGAEVTSSAAEINTLDGFTGSVDDLNYAKDLRASGVTAGEYDTLSGVTASTAELNLLDGVTATTAELNYVDGVTSNIQTQLDAKGTVSSLSDLSVTATADELNKLDGVTATTAELNLVDGLTAIPDYVTGIFTPVVADAVSGGNTATVGTAVGRYTKVGRMVHVTIQLVNITTTGMSGNIYVRNLPFTAYDAGSPSMLWMGTLYASQVTTGTDGPFVPLINDNTDYIQFIRSITASSQVAPLTVSNLTSGASDMYVSISYEAA